MPYTVRLIEAPGGWFASASPAGPATAGARVRWESVFDVEAQAISVLGLADLLAKKLTDGSCRWREKEDVGHEGC